MCLKCIEPQEKFDDNIKQTVIKNTIFLHSTHVSFTTRLDVQELYWRDVHYVRLQSYIEEKV